MVYKMTLENINGFNYADEKKVVVRPEALLGARLGNIVPNATEPEDFAQKCIDTLEDKIDYNTVWGKFDEMYDNRKIIQKLKVIIHHG